jgi:tRNA (guanosine-2'-O-)-methyltransferase
VSPRRPPRAWIGSAKPADPEDLIGPRGLIAEVLELPDVPQVPEDPQDPESREEFFWALLTPARKARILSVIDARLASVTVVLDRLVDPHNTAAILRTAEGLGLARAHVVPHDAEDPGHAHRRVTQDAQKWIEVEQHPSGAACAVELNTRGFEVWAGHLDDGARLYTELPADRPLALLFGNEHEGPQAETVAACTGTFRIPMAGFTQSFNVSVAAGMALAHLTRARRAHLGAAGDLSPAERVELRTRFTLLAAKLARRVKHRG